MREIKFRAWDKPIKRWYSPVYEALKNKLEELNIGMNGRLSLRTMSGTYDVSTFEDRFEIMQYTGLKDKNSVEIYEGDIVKVISDVGVFSIDEWLAIVEWEVSAVRFGLKEINGESARFADFDSSYDDFEVIGNIYENPELLEAQSSR